MIPFKPIVRSLFSTKLPSWLAGLYFSNVLIAIAAATLYLTAADIPPSIRQLDWLGACFLFCITLLYYSLHDWYSKVYRRLGSERPRALHWQQHWRWLSALPVLALMALPWLAWAWLSASRLVWLLLFGSVAAVYSFPVVPARWRHRRHPLLKLAVLALTWAALPVLLSQSDSSLPAAQAWLITQRCLLLLLICIPFDWRDAAHDRATGAFTLPDYCTAVQARNGLFALAAAHLLLLAVTTPLLAGFFPLLLAGLPTAMALWLASQALKRPEWPLGYLLLDTMLIVQPLVVGVLQHLAYIR